jgi:tetratricopeptide (TPR) repeat protein
MKISLLSCLIFLFLFCNSGMAQTNPKKPAEPATKTYKLTPGTGATPVTADPKNQNQQKDKIIRVPLKKETQLDSTQRKAMELFKSGNEKLKKKSLNAAILDFTKSIELVKNPRTYSQRGYTYIMMENYPAAIEDANEALKLSSKIGGQPYLILGISHYELNDYELSEKELKQALSHDPKNSMAFNYLAAIHFLRQDYQGAHDLYDSVARISPNYPEVYTNRGMMNHYMRKYENAILDYNEALRVDSINFNAYNNRAASEMALGDLAAALKDLDKALRINSEYKDALDNRGRVKQLQGDLEGACADWKRSLSLGGEAAKELVEKYCQN